MARKTRQKNKDETELLRDQLVSLSYENHKLKELMKSHLPSQVSANMLVQSELQIPENVRVLINTMMQQEIIQDCAQLTSKQRSFVVVNPNLPDNPLVHVSDGFIRLTGYTREESVGKNCRFLQGEHTDVKEVAHMKAALQQKQDFSIVLLNYTKDNTPFWNLIEIAHIRDQDEQIQYVIATQQEVSIYCLLTK